MRLCWHLGGLWLLGWRAAEERVRGQKSQRLAFGLRARRRQLRRTAQLLDGPGAGPIDRRRCALTAALSVVCGRSSFQELRTQLADVQLNALRAKPLRSQQQTCSASKRYKTAEMTSQSAYVLNCGCNHRLLFTAAKLAGGMQSCCAHMDGQVWRPSYSRTCRSLAVVLVLLRRSKPTPPWRCSATATAMASAGSADPATWLASLSTQRRAAPWRTAEGLATVLTRLRRNCREKTAGTCSVLRSRGRTFQIKRPVNLTAEHT